MAQSKSQTRIHPGAGRRRAVPHDKGRQIDPAAMGEIRSLLADRPRRRDLLIEYLHLIQDEYHALSARHLNALAIELNLAQAEVYEVATFYAHFDVIKEDQTPPPPLTVRVCGSLTCDVLGARDLLDDLKDLNGDKVRIVSAPCMGGCDRAPFAEVGHNRIGWATSRNVRAAVGAAHTAPRPPAAVDLAGYEKAGGYRLLRACRAGEIDRSEGIVEILEGATLRGLGGAGFPTGRKWQIVRDEPGPRMMAVNADEGEPGTFKDRHYLETDPHRFLEGMLIAAWVVDVAEIYIYLRDEYPHIRVLLEAEIAKLRDAGLAGDAPIHLRRGAGAYICGEESAMLESIEGKRGLPRHRPPYAAQVGLFGRPTLINNVETLYWVRDIVEDGADRFAAEGRHGAKGLRSYSVSGRVREPGVKLAPAGITVRELIDEYCGGMAEGHEFHAYLPGGASGGILPARLGDLPLEFGTLEKYGCFIGSHAVIVLSDKDDVRQAALNLMRFFEDESCGQCTPCRVGTEKAVTLMEQKEWDEALLRELGTAMAEASICGLGQAAANPLFCVFEYFGDDPT